MTTKTKKKIQKAKAKGKRVTPTKTNKPVRKTVRSGRVIVSKRRPIKKQPITRPDREPVQDQAPVPPPPGLEPLGELESHPGIQLLKAIGVHVLGQLPRAQQPTVRLTTIDEHVYIETRDYQEQGFLTIVFRDGIPCGPPYPLQSLAQVDEFHAQTKDVILKAKVEHRGHAEGELAHALGHCACHGVARPSA